jgi:hypothetical protein
MANTPLVIVDQDPEIKTLYARIAELRERTIERVRFLEKRMDAAIKEGHTDAKKEWDAVHKVLKTRGALPTDFDETKHKLKYDDGVISVADIQADNGIPAEVVKQIFAFISQNQPPNE